jgi:hypothetical protein
MAAGATPTSRQLGSKVAGAIRRHRSILLTLFCVALLLEPLGHELGYVLRFGLSRALIVQANGSHAYFPRLVETITGLLALVLIASLLAFAAVRLTLGRRNRYSSGAWWPAFLALAATQYAVFLVHETLEAISGHSHPDFLAIATLGVCGQFPIAAIGAWFISKLGGYVALAPQAVRLILAPRLARQVEHIRLRPAVRLAVRPVHTGRECYLRRAPPTVL